MGDSHYKHPIEIEEKGETEKVSLRSWEKEVQLSEVEKSRKRKKKTKYCADGTTPWDSIIELSSWSTGPGAQLFNGLPRRCPISTILCPI